MASFKIISVDKEFNHVTVEFSTDDGIRTITDTMCDIPLDDEQAALELLAARCAKWGADIAAARSNDALDGLVNKEQTVSAAVVEGV